ncbi:MAG TPA: gamma-glutamyltransferase [Ilumatobacteraceae bacterium]|nr:gamma-glutamyltransferase [Ilumatobacteraceae bacterium]HRB02272.1 gamma-glutamyltransferase [Ilumatobacteraceae bacterium]
MSAPFNTTRAPNHMVASADALATQAGLAILTAGGNAVDAAIATNAAMAVVAPHLCGMGGDLFALVHDGSAVHALNASGRAGSGASAAAVRADGHSVMPFRHDVRTVTIPGCVDGWSELLDRFATLPLKTLLAPAIALAEGGFPASPLLIGSIARLDPRARENLRELCSQAVRPGDRVCRPGVAEALRAVATGGREAFYEGEFGAGLQALGAGWFTAGDLARSQAEWVTPLSESAWDVELWTIPPNSQGYLTLGAAALASRLSLPTDPNDEYSAHLLIEAAKVAGFDRPTALHEAADGFALLRRIAARADLLNTERAGDWPMPARQGDTTYLCTTDSEGMGVSLIQSNASGFGSWLVEPHTQINLHNRGLGFDLEAGHSAELMPGARPPHTLSPALATRGDDLAAVFGTMGGDAQPQILLQLAARLFHYEQSPAVAMHAGRWALSGPLTGFDTWSARSGPIVEIEGHAPAEWATALTARGHAVSVLPEYDSAFGHAQVIMRDANGFWAGATDPRARVGSVAGG